MATGTLAPGIPRHTGMAPLADIRQHRSPNCGPRRDGLEPSLIVIHHTAMENAHAALERLCDPAAEVSAHYLVCASGEVVQMVPEELRAWHAGVGSWAGLGDINSRSIGIELDNRGATPFAAAQMDALERLLRGIMARWNIAADGVIGHSDMAPGRKTDPGPHFDWQRLARQGLAGATACSPANADQFLPRARAAGYSAQVDDETLLSAVRLRYRPFAKGPLSAEDVAVLSPSET